MQAKRRSTVVVVGVCGSGKTELVRRLRHHGYQARVVAQEHSFVRTLWRHQGVPDHVIVLTARPETVAERGRTTVTATILTAQVARLTDAERVATLVVATDDLSPSEVAAFVLERLRE